MIDRGLEVKTRLMSPRPGPEPTVVRDDTVVLIRSQYFEPAVDRLAHRLSEETGYAVCCVLDERNGATQASAGIAKIGLTDARIDELGVYRAIDYPWRCGDYPFYLARRSFPSARWFWQIESDVLINFSDAGAFFARFAQDTNIDLLTSYLSKAPPHWGWSRTMAPFLSRVLRCFFPVIRLSAPAIDHLLMRRRELSGFLQQHHGDNSTANWPNDEVFVASTLGNGGWLCADLNSHGTVYTEAGFGYYRAFSEQALKERDDLLYHPVLRGAAFLRRVRMCLQAMDDPTLPTGEKQIIRQMLRRPTLRSEIFQEASVDEAQRIVSELAVNGFQQENGTVHGPSATLKTQPPAAPDESQGMRETADRITLLVHPNMTDVLRSVVQMLAEGLREIGIETEVVPGLASGFMGRAIVLGANFYTPSELEGIAENSIIFNVENTSSRFLTDEYRRLMRKFTIWDFSENNAAYLSRAIVRPVHYLKMFYVDRLSRIPGDVEQDIDVLFYGSFNGRRSQVLDSLRERGLRVHAVYRVFGSDLDQLIARSKVIINIHFYPNGCLELIRIFDLLANSRAVVTELNAGEPLDADLASALVAVPYDALVDATEALVRDSDRREQLAKEGFRAFSQRRASAILRDALAWSDLPRLPSDAVVGSGKMYDPRLLNIDSDDRWHPDIVADIADPDLFARDFISRRFGAVRMQQGWFDSLTATHVLEHVPNLVAAMTNCLSLLTDGGVFRITVPYDLSYGAWQDPTHVHAFNERSWLYYCEWYWYLGWDESRFVLTEIFYKYSPLGAALAAQGISQDEILRTPRAVDEMSVVLSKRSLTESERAYGRDMRGDKRG